MIRQTGQTHQQQYRLPLMSAIPHRVLPMYLLHRVKMEKKAVVKLYPNVKKMKTVSIHIRTMCLPVSIISCCFWQKIMLVTVQKIMTAVMEY